MLFRDHFKLASPTSQSIICFCLKCPYGWMKDPKPCADTCLCVISNLCSISSVAASEASRDQRQIKFSLWQIKLTFGKEHFEDLSWKHCGRRDLFKLLNMSEQTESPPKAEVKLKQRSDGGTLGCASSKTPKRKTLILSPGALFAAAEWNAGVSRMRNCWGYYVLYGSCK